MHRSYDTYIGSCRSKTDTSHYSCKCKNR